MPEKIEVTPMTPGGHPDASGADPINRNTTALGNLVLVVQSHESTMQGLYLKLQDNIDRLTALEKSVQEKTDSLVERLEALTNTLAEQFDKLSSTTETNTTAIKLNITAMKELRRGF